MANDDPDAVSREDLSLLEAREALLQLIATDDIAEHEDIYEALARE